MRTVTYPFLKGHGTENDFVVLPDHDGAVHGELTAARVRALCDRRAGIGADGVLRVIRASTDVVGEGTQRAQWFMDYRNADGSVAEMCGNGIRVFARHLVDDGMVEPHQPILIASRDGVKSVIVDGDLIRVGMGLPKVLGPTWVTVGGERWRARHVELGNPHVVAFVDDLGDFGRALEQPGFDREVFPTGVNVELVVRRPGGVLAMRVHERGSGETRSCGTGACAVAAAAATADGHDRQRTYQVEVPGGELEVTASVTGDLVLAGPAVIVARGETAL
jgi:diaminopimelate epimerase